MRIAIATCSLMPYGLAEDDLAASLDATWLVWDDPAADWAAFDVVLVRSVWDADQRRDEFVAWAHRVAERSYLLNPAPVLEWNTDKRYLAELPAAGLPVVPTEFLPVGASLTEDVLTRLGTPAELVVKPAQSAGSRDTGRFALPDDLGMATALAARIHAAEKVVMVQPYLDAIDTAGETALLYFGGAYSHAIRKAPILEVGAEPLSQLLAADPQIDAREPSAAERRLGDRVLAWLIQRWGTPPAYARVDLIPGPDGPVVIELELTEPQLYLPYGDGASEHLAGVVRALAERALSQG